MMPARRFCPDFPHLLASKRFTEESHPASG
jgi:hypothetical protein